MRETETGVALTMTEVYQVLDARISELEKSALVHSERLLDHLVQEHQELPPEPMNLGAVVRDGNGDIWVKFEEPGRRAWVSGMSVRSRWGDMPQPVTVLHEGWQR